MRGCFADLGFLDRHVTHGSIDTAIEQLPAIGWPRFLIVDIGGFADPMSRINRLAEICSPTTEVIVVGERNESCSTAILRPLASPNTSTSR